MDLAAFLRDPRAPEVAEFVEHYPRCPDCAAEVRAWTEVHLGLDPPHPAPAELLAYADGALQTAPRAAVEAHLAGCASCAEELRAVRRFDTVAHAGSERAEPARLRRSAPAASPGPGRGRLGRVLWHPAFAYAVALLVLVPTLIDVARRPTSLPRAREPARVSGMPAADRELRQPAPPPHPAPPAAERAVPAEDPVAPPPSTLFLSRRPGPAAGKLAEPQHHEAREQPKRPAAAGEIDASVTRAPRGAAEPAPGPTLDAHTGMLTVPVPDAARRSATVEVRVRDAAGARELRQRVDLPRAGEPFTIHLPADWVSPGRWEVELHAAGAVMRFPLRVP